VILSSFLGFLEDGDHLRAAFRYLLSNHAKIQVSIIGLILVAVVDDLPFLDAVPSVSSRADVFLGVAVGEVDVVGAEVGYATVGANSALTPAVSCSRELVTCAVWICSI
jgi:hypothetical protein